MCCTCLSHTQSHRSKPRTYTYVHTRYYLSAMWCTYLLYTRPADSAQCSSSCTMQFGGDQISISFNSNKRQSTFALKIDGRHFQRMEKTWYLYLKMHAILLCHPYLLLYFVYVLILLLMAHKQEFTYLVMRMTSKLSFCLVCNQN